MPDRAVDAEAPRRAPARAQQRPGVRFTRRTGGIERLTISRHSLICYGYATHYVCYVLILGAMAMCGSFTKSSDPADSPISNMIWPRDAYPDYPCQKPMEDWFAVFVFFCPIAAVGSGLLAKFRAKNNHTQSVYHLETWRRQYTILSNSDRVLNWTMLFIDVFNILWALIGSILSNVLAQGPDGALDECMRDYGISGTCIAFVLMVLGYCKLLRLALYQVTLVWHQEVFGWAEARTRKNINVNADRRDLAPLKFSMITYDPGLQASTSSDPSRSPRSFTRNKTCSICCIDFEEGEAIVCLPCSIQRESRKATAREAGLGDRPDDSSALMKEEEGLNYMHTFHKACIKAWFERSNQCPLCKQDVMELQYRSQHMTPETANDQTPTDS